MFTKPEKKDRNLVGVLLLMAIVTAFYIFLFLSGDQRIWLNLHINFIFFIPLTAGLVTWPAIIFCSRGTWTQGAQQLAFRAFWFLPLSVILMLLLWFGRGYWAPWPQMAAEHSIWLSSDFVFARVAFSLIAFSTAAFFFIRNYSSKKLGATIIILYCVTFSIMGFDFVMALNPKWYSALLGAYFFISGIYAAAVAWTLAYTFSDPIKPEVLEDLTKLVITFCLLTTYLMYSQLIVIWYENLPNEAVYLVSRLNLEPWKYFSAVLLCIVYLGPLLFFLTHRARINRLFVRAVCLILLAGLWLERWWLIVPGAQKDYARPGLLDLISVTAFASLFLLIYTLSGLRHERAE